jgi:hypothetical protein
MPARTFQTYIHTHIHKTFKHMRNFLSTHDLHNLRTAYVYEAIQC